MSVTQWVWHEALGMDYWLPPEVKKGERYGPDEDCWLCGGPTDGVGWPLAKGIKPTFAEFSAGLRPQSQAACGACVALSSSESFGQYARSRGLPDHFPAREGKKPRALNWLYSSHIITLDQHDMPDRAGWRAALLSPPEPPFVMAMAVSGKRHVLFRAQVSGSREHFTVQAEETRIQVDRSKFECLLAEFEEAYALGLSKTSLQTGQYNQKAILAIGVGRWREIEERMAEWRAADPGLMQLAAYCGQRAA